MPTATPQPPSQEDILDAALATLTDADIPPGDDTRAVPDPDRINLTIPLTTLLGLSSRPGEAAGYGPLDARTARQLACALAGHRATRWQIIVTDPAGQALAAGTTRGPVTPGTVAAAGGR